MATASVTNTLVDGNTIFASEHNTNYGDLVSFINTNCVQKDGSLAMTAALNLVGADPSADNHASRKAYVDKLSFAPAITGLYSDQRNTTDSGSSVNDLVYHQVLTKSVSVTQDYWYRADFFLPRVYCDEGTTGFFYRILAEMRLAGTKVTEAMATQFFADEYHTMSGYHVWKASATTSVTIDVRIAYNGSVAPPATITAEAASTNPAKLTVVKLGKS